MNLLQTGQRNISILTVAGFLSILVLSMGFSAAVLYKMARLQSNARALYDQSLSMSNAGQGMLANLSRMHELMLQSTLVQKAGQLGQIRAQLQGMDAGVRQYLDAVSAQSVEFRANRAEIIRQLNAWDGVRDRTLDLIQHNHRDQAVALGMREGVTVYSQLVMSLDALVQEVRTRAKALSDEGDRSTRTVIRAAWWMLGGLAIFNALWGTLVIWRISRIMKNDATLVMRLYQDEQRLRMALTGGNEGTWDLDVTTGRLNFDAQWANLLGFGDHRPRPSTLEQWSARIFSDDRERVLKAMHDHIAGRTEEYREEYRIHDESGNTKWVAGRGKATVRDSLGKAKRVVGITRDITQRKLSEQSVWMLAHTDALTRLPNRALLYDRLTQVIAYARRHENKFALLYMDLDGFKPINDNLGHDVGDKLLQEVAGRLVKCIRGEDTLARVGGDEFVFVLNDIGNSENAANVAEKILDQLRQEIIIDNNACRIGASIGISIFPNDASEMELLLSQADKAMYRAKAMGKNTYRFYGDAPEVSSAA